MKISIIVTTLFITQIIHGILGASLEEKNAENEEEITKSATESNAQLDSITAEEMREAAPTVPTTPDEVRLERSISLEDKEADHEEISVKSAEVETETKIDSEEVREAVPVSIQEEARIDERSAETEPATTETVRSVDPFKSISETITNVRDAIESVVTDKTRNERSTTSDLTLSEAETKMGTISIDDFESENLAALSFKDADFGEPEGKSAEKSATEDVKTKSAEPENEEPREGENEAKSAAPNAAEENEERNAENDYEDASTRAFEKESDRGWKSAAEDYEDDRDAEDEADITRSFDSDLGNTRRMSSKFIDTKARSGFETSSDEEGNIKFAVEDSPTKSAAPLGRHVTTGLQTVTSQTPLTRMAFTPQSMFPKIPTQLQSFPTITSNQLNLEQKNSGYNLKSSYEKPSRDAYPFSYPLYGTLPALQPLPPILPSSIPNLPTLQSLPSIIPSSLLPSLPLSLPTLPKLQSTTPILPSSLPPTLPSSLPTLQPLQPILPSSLPPTVPPILPSTFSPPSLPTYPPIPAFLNAPNPHFDGKYFKWLPTSNNAVNPFTINDIVRPQPFRPLNFFPQTTLPYQSKIK